MLESPALLILFYLQFNDFPLEKIVQRLNKPRAKSSLSNFLRKQLNLSPAKLALLRELTIKKTFENTDLLAMAMKKLSLTLTATRPIDEAISSMSVDIWSCDWICACAS